MTIKEVLDQIVDSRDGDKDSDLLIETPGGELLDLQSLTYDESLAAFIWTTSVAKL